MKEEILNTLKEITKEEIIQIDIPENTLFGDYSSNIAMIMAKKEGKNPYTLAEEIVAKLQGKKNIKLIFEKIEVAGAGFINFYIAKDILLNNLKKVDEKYGNSDLNKGKITIVEYSSPNIAKPFTIGHLRSTIIGDAVANLLEASGWKVFRDNHLGDWGTQFGKMIYAIKTWGNEGKISKLDNPVKELVTLYVKFHEEAEKNINLEDEGRKWFKKLEEADPEAKRIWKRCIDWSFVEFDRIYKSLNVSFSKEFENGRGLGESFFVNRMSGVISELEERKLLKIGKEGAKLVFFEKDKYPPAMIIKKDGTTLYHTRDLATDKYRLEKYNPDLIINEVGSEQTLYFRQLFEMEKLLGWFKEGQRIHLGHGLYRFKEGKMSTRKGNVIWMEDVLKEAIEKATKLGSKGKISKIVAIGALKYNDLKRDPKTEIVFDWNEILNMNGNSGPYLQYTFARTRSVLFKSKSINKVYDAVNINSEEEAILRAIVHFPEVILISSSNYAPNLLCNYLFELASKFNTFYNKHSILTNENESVTSFRLNLTKSVGQIIKNGLNILGIEAPERM
ncbi:arginine--tRNA ligase [Candidatus Woesebacteria bacterium RIFOXYC1_FULL_31_51]|uniref:Arginine--tRNA ligase n=1 Tax=Candidatus Woesebacteria bacterium GW2011_GWC2_31_9 TaxID=1618586 RepID=A0A0F9YI75_9BACT|nr:MAG: Arginyl-tRNA synthetase [Candidatus Woesebacteria bacterium GW2011_GWF1_31_35]KKP23047.1 MAG: Arginine-tRNA ligase [Candidatus Woesebacteria bacterium GW2011_GWC1_30_29]KKP25337.1 MAG: Arginine-tRNA ligase [Candidatus Woesebacteria bacterium GW2011_GWD1_31_12]KKP27289.1 MAG: Arginine-tRNA ligase [Candidatus Woesebacteria bacterium GW2011_GWB1_31_29]KKP31224.1 MAG: Arginine-tRNA ligase [Candidatus Woesebacteria bacterium GW2011_GWC2_31_9]KKP33459.1 MAG: Arginine-tRNA ligase [Candidatus 